MSDSPSSIALPEAVPDAFGFSLKMGEPNAPDSDSVGREFVSMAPVEMFASEYNMSHENRGIAVIINNETFYDEKQCPWREGTAKDCRDFTTVLESLGFKVEVCQDYDVSQIHKKIVEVRDRDHSKNDCLLIAVMTHGSDGERLHAKDALYEVNQLWEKFTPDNCPTLAGKPKLFFIQACRGTKKDAGHMMERTVHTDNTESIDNVTFRAPIYADFLFSYATFPGFVSWRDPSQGTCYVQSLCGHLKKYSNQRDLVTLLTFVHQTVALQFESINKDLALHKKKQIPMFNSTLMRLVYLRRNQEGMN